MTTSPADPQVIADQPVDLLAELESMARQSDDAAVSCRAIYEWHHPEFVRLSKDMTASQENHVRLMELYGHTILDQAKRLDREARTLRDAIARLRRYETALQEVAAFVGYSKYDDLPFDSLPDIAAKALEEPD